MIYYAHPLHLFGKPQEARDIDTLERLGFDVVNPNNPSLQAEYDKHGMSVCVNWVRRCDALVFRAFPDGSIPTGIQKEINAAISVDIPVIELPGESRMTSRLLDQVETDRYLREVGER